MTGGVPRIELAANDGLGALRERLAAHVTFAAA
jgi:hypothetical protein